MRDPSHMFRLVTELVFMLAGALLIFVGLTGRYLAGFNARGPAWLALAVILIFRGVRGWRQSRLAALRSLRLGARFAGASLVLAGIVMLSLAWAQFWAVGPLLAAAGAIFVVRGLVTAAIVALGS